jgi:TRAP-type mannitol/chloroaromatic compound transport system permease small subunit
MGLQALERLVELILAAAKWLALPIVAALFLQWPLRELVGAYSRQANDLGQWIFALYIAAAVTAATRTKTHLAADTLARYYPSRWRERLARLGILLGLLPWAVFVLVTSRYIVLSSVLSLEQFPDTYNPGYYLIKVALWLLALLVLLEGVIELFRPAR